jgi:uncharacterized membrane protein YidH (DUF202 family)
MEMKYSAEEAVSKLNLWMLLHWIRTAVVLISAIFAIRAIK